MSTKKRAKKRTRTKLRPKAPTVGDRLGGIGRPITGFCRKCGAPTCEDMGINVCSVDGCDGTAAAPNDDARQPGRKDGWVDLALGAEVNVNMDVVVADPLEHFRKEWDRLPPMIRAGEATAIALRLAQSAHNDEAQKEWCRAARLPRREKVAAALAAARAMIQHLFLSLARTADEDAEKLGIDVNIAPPAERVVWTKGDQKIVITTRAPASEKK